MSRPMSSLTFLENREYHDNAHDILLSSIPLITEGLGFLLRFGSNQDRVSWGWIFVPWDREDLFWSLGFTRHYVFPGLGARYAPETTISKAFWHLRPTQELA